MGKEALEACAPCHVEGYRAMAFSLSADMAWAFESLRDCGYRYDSSILQSINRATPFANDLFGVREIFGQALSVKGKRIPVSAGIGFRMLPMAALIRLIRSHNRNGLPFLLYFHAWEFNKDQPARNINRFQKISQSPLFFNGKNRLQRLHDIFRFSPIGEALGRGEPN